MLKYVNDLLNDSYLKGSISSIRAIKTGKPYNLSISMEAGNNEGYFINIYNDFDLVLIRVHDFKFAVNILNVMLQLHVTIKGGV